MSLTGFEIPPPRSWQAFEALCHDLFSREWNVDDANRIGRNGQRQNGVDIVACVAGRWVGVQCKWVGRTAEIAAADLHAIANEARQFRPVLTQLVIATTAPNDASLQQTSREISDAHGHEGTFTVSLLCWDDLLARLDAQPAVVARHYAALLRFLGAQNVVTTHYGGRIDSFTRQYVGDASHDIPFVGRQEDLDTLDRWLADERAIYALLRAPAGRGKSALLANWTASLGDSLALVFMPISARFRTNLAQVVFESLLARLATLHGLELPDAINVNVERARGLVTDLLTRPLPDGLRLLLVIDGLDEAADFEITPDLFPPQPPSGLKILCAGRPVTLRTDPLHSLAPTHLNLPPLASGSIEEALESRGTDPAVAANVVRLSQGDPLLVRLYLEALGAGELDPQRLTKATPGLNGYFSAWWEDQQRLWQSLGGPVSSLVEDILCLLACALGPLSRDDLLDPALMGARPTLFELDGALEKLSRWIVGHGRRNDLILSHPLFADYLREEWMPVSRVQQVEAQFVGWGEAGLRTLESEPDGNLSPYLIANLGAHFIRAGFAQDRFEPLTRRAWADQCFAVDPSLRGFLADVGRRVSVTRRESHARGLDVASLLALIDCALTIATVRSIAHDLPPNVYVAALRLGIWSADTVLEHMLAVRGDDLSAGALMEVAKGAGIERSPEVLALALSTDNRFTRAESLRQLYLVLAQEEQAQIVSELVRAAEVSGYHTAHGPPLPTDVSLRIARTIEQPSERATALAKLLPSLEAEEAEAIEDEIESLILGNPGEFRKGIYYHGALRNMSDTRRVRLVAQLLEQLEDDQQKRAALTEIGYEPDRGLIDLFLRCAAGIEDDWIRADALKIVAKSVPKGKIPAYLELADSISPKAGKAAVLAALGKHYGGEWVETALAICRTVQIHPSLRAPILVDASHHLSDEGRLAIEPMLLGDLNTPMDSRAWDDHDPEWLLADFAFTFSRTRPEHTIRLLGEIAEGEVRARAAANLVVEGPAAIRAEAMALLESVEGPFGVLEAYSHIAEHSTGEERGEACAAAVAHARAHGTIDVLIDLAVAEGWDIERELGKELVQDALELGAVHDWHELGAVLVAFAQFTSANAGPDAFGALTHIGYEIQVQAVARAYADKFSGDELQRLLAAAIQTSNRAFGASLLQIINSYLDADSRRGAADWAASLQEQDTEDRQAKIRFLAACAAGQGNEALGLVKQALRLVRALPEKDRRAARETLHHTLTGVRRYSRPPDPGLNYSRSAFLDAACKTDDVRNDHWAWFELLSRQPREEIEAVVLILVEWASTADRAVLLKVLARLAPSIDRIGGEIAANGVVALLRKNVEAWGRTNQPRRKSVPDPA